LQLAASDPDGDALTYGASGLPAGLTVDAATGLISGTLSAASAGTSQVTAIVSDGSLSASQTFSWIVSSSGSLLLNSALTSTLTAANIPQIIPANTPTTLVNPGNQTTATARDYLATVQADAPVQYLRFGEASRLSALDSSRYGRTGTYHGVIGYGQAGAVGDGTTGLALTGAPGTYVDAGPSSFTIGPENLTIETWIKTTTADDVLRYVADNTGSGSNAAGLSLMLQSGRVLARVGNGTAQFTVAGSRVNLNDGAWHHVTVVFERYYDGVHDRLLIFVDGVPDSVGTLAVAGWNVTSTRNFEIGRRAGSDRFSFIGALDEWAMYDVALSATQIDTHYARRVSVGTAVALQLTATDPDGDRLTYSATGLPTPLTINPGTGLISGTLAVGDAGTYTVTVAASDGISLTSQTFTWTITPGGL